MTSHLPSLLLRSGFVKHGSLWRYVADDKIKVETLNEDVIYEWRLFFYFCAMCGIGGGLLGLYIGISEHNMGISLSSLSCIAGGAIAAFYIRRIAKRQERDKRQDITS